MINFIIFRNYILSCMIRLFTLLVLLVGSNFLVSGQTPASRGGYSLSDFNTWSFGASMGLTYPRTDITGNGGGFGISLNGTKFLSNHFALQARLIHASISGEDINRPDYKYNSTINYDFTLNAILQSNKLILLPQPLRDKVALYVSGGIGIINYTPDIWLDGGYFTLHGIYSQYTQEYDTFNYSGTTDLMVPFSIGAKYHLKDKISLNLEYTYRVTNGDKLDGFFKLLSNNDSYSFINVGVIFLLGKKSKSIEWTAPDDPSYAEMEALKLKLEKLSVDTDGDGVPDVHDKEPNTPAGYQVYGDGRSVDTDGDGVTDKLDEEPFSPKNVKVDNMGREIRPVVEATPANTPAIVTEAEKPSAMPSIYFDFDSYRISKEYSDEIQKIAKLMQSNKSVNYMISGICDNKNEMHQIDISNRRAEAVKNQLVKKYKINQARLKTEVLFVPPDFSKPSVNRRVDLKPR